VCHSTLGSKVIKKKERMNLGVLPAVGDTSKDFAVAPLVLEQPVRFGV